MAAKKSENKNKTPTKPTGAGGVRKASQRSASSTSRGSLSPSKMPHVNRPPHRAVSPTQSESTVGHNDTEELADDDTTSRINDIVTDLHTLRDAVDHSNSRMDAVDNSIKNLTRFFEKQATMAPPSVGPSTSIGPTMLSQSQVSPFMPALTSTANPGNNPLIFLSTNFHWLTADQPFLEKIISRKMEVRDLVKLIPEEDRPTNKGKSPTGLASGFHIDAATEKITLVRESSITYEKEFPNFATAIYALSIYGAIRDLFDIDRIGFGPAIFAYIRILTKWHNNDRFEWEHIRAYLIAHFHKHQSSLEPKAWSEIDVQLHAIHIRPHPTARSLLDPNSLSPQKISSPSKAPKSPNSLSSPNKQAVCNNWNTEGKGCTWSTCERKHICSTCRRNDHTAYNCSTSQKP